MNQEVLVTLLDFTEVLISNREKIENTEDRNPNISNGVVEMDFDIQFGLCSNFMEFSYLSDSKYHNIPTEFLSHGISIQECQDTLLEIQKIVIRSIVLMFMVNTTNQNMDNYVGS